MTSRLAEMRDEGSAFVLGHVKFLCKTGQAQKFGRAAVDELFRQPDLVAVKRPAADLAGVHYNLTTFAR